MLHSTARTSTVVPQAVAAEQNRIVILALCQALPVLLDALKEHAYTQTGANRALVWALRQAGLIVLGALEQISGCGERAFEPKHLTREREIRLAKR